MAGVARIFKGILILALALAMVGPVAAYEFNPHGWTVPNIYGAIRESDEMLDFDPSVPGAETRLEIFRLPNNVRIFRYSHNGNTFAWEVDLDGYDPPDYELVDMDGSGGFEIKQSPYSEFHLPRWTFKPYEYPLAGGGMVVKNWTAGRPTSQRLAQDLHGQGGQSAQNLRVSLDVPFELNSARLTPEARNLLDELGSAMNSEKLRNYNFLIEGHTDALGGPDYNLRLSEQRALAVEAYLADVSGVDRGRMTIAGKGETQPLPGMSPADGINRRVEIVNMGIATEERPTPKQQVAAESPAPKQQAAAEEKFE